MILKLRQPPVTPEKKEAIFADYQAGMTIKEIVTNHQISQHTLYKLLHKEIEANPTGTS